MKAKKVFNNYILSVLFAFLTVAIFNFASSAVKLFLGQTISTPVYAKVVDSVSTTSANTEAKDTASIEKKSKAIASTYSGRRTTARASYITNSNSTISGNYVSVNGRKITLEYKQPAGSTLIVPNNHAAYFGSLIYGHNISSVFAYLNSASVGETITVSINGQVKTYTIVKKERKAINQINMSKLVYTRSYAYTMMTCVGNGATHRDIIYLN